MSTICVATALSAVITCTGVTPKPPAEALRILTTARPPYVPPEIIIDPARADGPRIVEGSGGKSPKDWPEPSPRRRLDGTLLDGPITVYGPTYAPLPYYYPTTPRDRDHRPRRPR